MARTSNRREFLQLADRYNPQKHKIAGWYVSEKLDGTRCFWDGGLSRGLPTETIPWASIIDPKTGKRKKKIKPVATGLWSRYGNPIMAPDWFLNQLPSCPLDGELWAGRGNFQLNRSICAGDEPDPRFDRIQYAVYSTPSLAAVFSTGEIKNTNFRCNMVFDRVEAWVHERLNGRDSVKSKLPTPRRTLGADYVSLPHGSTFEDEVRFLNEALENTPMSVCYLHQQTKLDANEDKAREQLETLLECTLTEGGEGLVVRDPGASWVPKRHKGLLKFKPFDDAEGRVIGFTSGRETDKGSKLLGRIGALILDYEGKRLELSGLTNEEREFASGEMGVFASAHPGVDMPEWFQGRHFKKGDIVTFLFRELSDDGIPKEARYFRKRDVE